MTPAVQLRHMRGRSERWRDVAELVRAPAALTVPGDSLAGAAAAGFPYGGRSWLTPLSSACLYWAGMALNDYADRELDQVERPERPIPSGRISPRQALGIATGLSGAGVGLAALAGGRPALRIAVPLAAAVWTYDLVAKPTVAGPFVMATARGLDVLLGAGGRAGPAAWPALTVAVHTAGVTGLSRGEVHGASPAAARLATVATAAATVAASLPPGWPRVAFRSAEPGDAVLGGGGWVVGRRPRPGGARPSRLFYARPHRGHRPTTRPPRVLAPTSTARSASIPGVAAGLAGVYAVSVGRAQWVATRTPDAATVRRATGVGIRGMIPLQAALTARSGAVAVAAGVLAAGPLAKLASKVVSPT